MIYGLISVIVVLLVALWFRHREASGIAYSYTEFLKDRLKERDAEVAQLRNFEPHTVNVVAAPPQSQAQVRQELDAPKEYTDEDLDERGLIRNGDGRVVEAEHPENMWETPQDYDDWIAFKREKGLPDDADPRDWQGRG